VTKTRSRPHVSNDNPYSEARFEALMYAADFPERFGSLEDARTFCQRSFDEYNHEHRHSGALAVGPIGQNPVFDYLGGWAIRDPSASGRSVNLATSGPR
jgi:hypothetical protein